MEIKNGQSRDTANIGHTMQNVEKQRNKYSTETENIK